MDSSGTHTERMGATAQDWLDRIKWDEHGLVPAIAQDAQSHRVLMVAWMNRESLAETARTGRAVYWSRSRQRLWRKGEESGNQQQVLQIRTDCDADVILLSVEQRGGVACHTGRESCFFNRLDEAGHWQIIDPVKVDPAQLYAAGKAASARDGGPEKAATQKAGVQPALQSSGEAAWPSNSGIQSASCIHNAELHKDFVMSSDTIAAANAASGAGAAAGSVASGTTSATAPAAVAGASAAASAGMLGQLADVIESRRGADPARSYVAKLLIGGNDKILKKIGEEATETVMAAKDGDKARIVAETADLWFHALVMLAHHELRPEDVMAELMRREGISGLDEKASRPKD